MAKNKEIVGYAVRERDGLRCWFKRSNKAGVFLDSSFTKARVYADKIDAERAARLLTKYEFRYKDGTPYVFETVEITV